MTQWQPVTPPSRRVRLLSLAIAAIPIEMILIGTLLVIWQLLGSTFGS